MREKIILLIKGMIIGVANIIPGVSGGTLAISLGIYQKLIEIISNFTKKLKNNLNFLLPIGIGVILALLLMSKVIIYSLDNYLVPTFIFFVGLILGGIPMLLKKVTAIKKKKIDIIILVTIVIGLIILSFSNESNIIVTFENMNLIDYFKLFLIGIVGAGSMIIPGISGSFILILLGYYRPLLELINNLFEFYKLEFMVTINNIIIFLPFICGLLVGFLLIAKIINYFFKKHEITAYYAIIGFVIGSVFIILKPLLSVNLTLPIVLGSALLGVLGFLITYYLGER